MQHSPALGASSTGDSLATVVRLPPPLSAPASEMSRRSASRVTSTVALGSALLFALAAGGTSSAEAAPVRMASADTAFTTALENRTTASPRSGVIVGRIDGDAVTVFKAGTSGTARPLDEHTVFEIGSVTKTFTATLLATMVLDGTVKLDDPVAKYMPPGVTVPARNGKKITLLDLATQHSGLPRLPDNLDTESSSDPYARYTVADMYAFVSHYKLTRDPGESFEYSNVGVALLGQALANRAGTSYARLLQRRVLAPLDMHDTTVSLTEAQRPRFAAAADIDGDPATPWTMQAIAPAGGLHSTLDDMLKYLRCNMGRGPLAGACTFAQTPRSTFPGNEIGLIWWTGDDRGLIHHGGDTAGFHASVAVSADRTRGVVVLGNGGMPVEDIAGHALDASVALTTLAASVTLPPDTLEAYVGTYAAKEDPERFVITRSGDHLLARLGKQDAYRIYAAAAGDFYYRVVDAQLHFIKDASGHATALVLHQGGRTIAYVAPGKAAPPEESLYPPVVSLASATLRQYVGDYAGAYGTFYVTLDGNQLMVRLEGQQAFPTYPSAKDRFFLKVVRAQIDFRRDAAGNVSGLTLHQSGQDVSAARK